MDLFYKEGGNRKPSAWNEFVAENMKNPKIKKLPFGDRLKILSKMYKSGGSAKSDYIAKLVATGKLNINRVHNPSKSLLKLKKRKPSMWNKFVAENMKNPKIKKLSFGDRIKMMSKMYKSRGAVKGKGITRLGGKNIDKLFDKAKLFDKVLGRGYGL